MVMSHSSFLPCSLHYALLMVCMYMLDEYKEQGRRLRMSMINYRLKKWRLGEANINFLKTVISWSHMLENGADSCANKGL